MARLNANGTLDTSFDSGLLINGYVACINLLANGSVLLGGGISAGNNSRMVQLTANGTLDTSFNVGNTINSELLAAAVQGDGKIVIGGYFSTINGVSRVGIARLNANGSLDTSFDPAAGLNDLPYAVVLDGSGQVVVGGKFTRAGGQVQNHIVRLDNLSAPGITRQPQSVLSVAGANVTFSVTAAGGQPLGYQWYFNGVNPVGANASTLTLLNVQAADVGNYTVVVTNALGSVTSSVAVLVLGTAPVVTLQPVSVTNNAGDTVSFTATGTGAPAVSYQWQFNGTNLSGGTGATLTLANVQIAQAGSYSVVLSNALGTATSTAATLTVLTAPVILTQPQTQGVPLGVDATFSVAAVANPSPSYQWRTNGVPVPDATNATFTVANVQLAQNGWVFSVVVSNALGTVTSTDATLVIANQPVITSQPQGQTLIRGGTAVFTVIAAGTGPLTYQWKLNGTNVAGATATTLTLTNVQVSQAGNYVVAVSNAAGGVLSSVAALAVVDVPGAGSLDSGFDVGTGGNAPVYAMAQQPDGLLVIGGAFDLFNGAALRRIARLKADGSLDPAFSPGTGADGSVYAVALQANGQIVLGGSFFNVNGVSRRSIARLNPDGSMDTSDNWKSNGARTDGNVNAVVIQPDGKIVIGGTFSAVNGVARNRLARLNPDGTLDTTFVPGGGPNNAVLGLALQPDGLLLVAGQFNSYNGSTHCPIARIYTDGSLDSTFGAGSSLVGYAEAIAVQPDGSILVAGGLSSVDGRNSKLLRLNYDGTRDATFLTGNKFNSDVLTVAVDPSGKILVGGYFTTVGGVSRNGVARMNADGTLDTGFDPGTGADNLVYAVLSDSSRRVVIGGAFTHVNGVSRSRVARLYGDVQPVFFAAQPQSITVAAGSPASFSVTLLTSGTATPPNYQWRFNGMNLPGETNPTLTIPAAFKTNAGVYDVVVSNSIGRIISSPATLAIAKSVPVVTWSAPASVTYGTPLSATQLNAAASVAGTFSFQPASGTVLNAGPSQNLVAVFTPSDTDDYSSVTVTQRVTVLTVPLTIKADDKAKYYGDPLPTFTASVVSLILTGDGSESGAALSLGFDPAVLRYLGATSGSGATGGALIVNDQLAGKGKLGLVLALPAGRTLAAGAHEIVRLTFAVTVTPPANTPLVVNSDQPVVREVTDVNANPLPAQFSSASFPIILPPYLKLLAMRRATDGTLQFAFGARDQSAVTPAQLARLQAWFTRDIGRGTWELLTNALTLKNGAVQLQDPDAASAGFRFYKVVETP